MPAIRKTINSNVTGVSVAEELEPKVLPGSPDWYDRAVISYSDFGGDVAYVADESINSSRQNQRGLPVGIEAGGRYNILMTNGLTRDMQGFFFADAHEKVDSIPLNGVAIPFTSVAVAGAYGAASGLTVFPVGAIVNATGFTNAANNGPSTVTAVLSTTLTTDRVTVVEASPPAAARIQQVGFAFGSGDLTLTVVGGTATLNSTAGDWFNIDVQVGEWLFIGGDAVGDRYDAGYGYGRVKSITTNDVIIDEIAWVGALATDTGVGKTMRIYVGTYIRNEKDPANIVCRTYNVERTLGSDDDGVQSEYLAGAVESELSLNLPLKERHTADFSYMALDNEYRTGLEGVKVGTHHAMPKQQLYNTSSTVFRLRMSILDPDTLDPTNMFAYASDATFTINNNISIAEAVSVFGGFDIIVGNFTVGGSVTAYFTTVASIKAIRDNADVGFNAILAQANRALVYDIPLLGVGGGRLNVEKDAAITVPLENFGAENDNGYTMSYTDFAYVPDIAMPTA
jgi:hypothetical protein